MKQEFPRSCCPAGKAAGRAWPLAFAGRACRYPARPVVTAMMPPVPWRPYLIDLLSPEIQEWLIVPYRHREIPRRPGSVPGRRRKSRGAGQEDPVAALALAGR